MAAPKVLHPGLLDYCESDAERQYLTAIIENRWSQTRTAKELGRNYTTVQGAVERVKRRAALQGFSPDHDMIHTAPDTHYVKGTSTLYGDDGSVKQQWVKTNVAQDRIEAIAREFVEACREDIPRERRVPAPKAKNHAELLNLYVITDYHYGMLAWGEETRGPDWDIHEAEDTLVCWFMRAIDQAPKAAVGVFCLLGDDLHFDGLDSVTPTSGHLLDADTRFPKIVRGWIRICRRIIRLMLEKYQTVHVISAEGNHNPVSSIWMREWFSALYEDEPRLTVDQSSDPYYCYEWGQTSLFFHHGHRKRVTNVSDVFVAKFRDVFGRTKHSYGHMGHLHHRDVKENNLMVVEQHRTLAAADAYASRHGFMSGREAQCITYHKEYGEVGRVTLSPEMVKEAS